MDRDKIMVIYGSKIAHMAYRLMDTAKIQEAIPQNAKVALKPNLVLSKHPQYGATTHPEVLDGIITYLKDHGIRNISIMESAWVGDSTKRAYKVCGYDELLKKHNVKLIDLKRDETVSVNGMTVCKSALDTDFLINIPVLKGHCQTRLTCALKNMKGCIPDSEKRRYHTLGLHDPIARLSTVLKPQLTIVDAICGDLCFEEGGNPVTMDRLMLGFDPVLIDTYACQLLGLSLSEVPYIQLAESLDSGTTRMKNDTIIELNRPSEVYTPIRDDQAQRLSIYVDENMACSACYGSLIHALSRADKRTLQAQKSKIKIGQGFKGQSLDGLGIGRCCSGCNQYVKGCPPKASDILETLNEL